MMLQDVSNMMQVSEDGKTGANKYIEKAKSLFTEDTCISTESSTLLENASLRAKFIKGIHGNDGKLGSIATHHHPSIWLDIVREVESLKHQGIDLSGFIRKKMGKGNDTLFWEDVWKGEVAFKLVYPRIYALDSCKNDTVAVKLSPNSMDHSFRRAPREGIEQTLY
ncbi:hypothetical protein Tco_0097805 [Tanacetum coccineum]